jgi:hypothetical protein
VHAQVVQPPRQEQDQIGYPCFRVAQPLFHAPRALPSRQGLFALAPPARALAGPARLARREFSRTRLFFGWPGGPTAGASPGPPVAWDRVVPDGEPSGAVAPLFFSGGLPAYGCLKPPTRVVLACPSPPFLSPGVFCFPLE